MTRINAGINPQRLSDKHLIAEHREIKRIPNTIRKGKAVIKNIPNEFTLGKGHVKFFYDKLYYLLLRYKAIHEECISRGFNVQNYREAWDNVPVILMQNWTPTEEAATLIRQRIYERGNYIIQERVYEL